MRLQRVMVLAVCAVFVMGVAALVSTHRHDRMYIVRTGSMTPAYEPGDAVIIRPSSSGYHVGDVVTFRVRSGDDAVVTHRIESVDAAGIHTKGDANATADPWTVQQSAVEGAVVGSVPKLGFVLVFVRQPTGALSTVALVLLIMLAWRMWTPPGTDAQPVAAFTQ